jgi:hypothetical protein
MHATLAMLVSLSAGLAGYFCSRSFVRRRLRFVDAVQSAWAPLVAGTAAALVVWPLTLLPLVGSAAVVLASLGTALGTASGARAIRRVERASRRLLP